MITASDIAWLAGLLEGEGSFSRQRNCLTIRASMTDEDVIHRAGRLLDCPVYPSLHNVNKNPKWSPVWSISLNGNRAAGWMMTLYKFMGERRKEKIRGILAEWRVAETIVRRPRWTAHYGVGEVREARN